MKGAAHMNLRLREKNAKKTLAEDKIPGVFYGKGIEARPIEVDRKEFMETYQENGQSKIFKVSIEGKTHQAYIKNLQRDVMKMGKVTHFDLLAIKKGDQIHTMIPIFLHGKENVERQRLLINQNYTELDVKYPVGIELEGVNIDVTDLKEGDSIMVSQLDLPEEVQVSLEPDIVILNIIQPKVVEESSEGEEASADEIPVVGKEE